MFLLQSWLFQCFFQCKSHCWSQWPLPIGLTKCKGGDISWCILHGCKPWACQIGQRWRHGNWSACHPLQNSGAWCSETCESENIGPSPRMVQIVNKNNLQLTKVSQTDRPAHLVIRTLGTSKVMPSMPSAILSFLSASKLLTAARPSRSSRWCEGKVGWQPHEKQQVMTFRVNMNIKGLIPGFLNDPSGLLFLPHADVGNLSSVQSIYESHLISTHLLVHSNLQCANQTHPSPRPNLHSDKVCSLLCAVWQHKPKPCRTACQVS